VREGMSTHKIEVVPLVLEPHPNADTLSVVHVWGYTCVIKTAEWQGVTQAAYVPPDYVLPDRPEYSFLKGSLRIRVRRFRGVMSQGLLLPAPSGSKIGDNVIEQLGIKRYEPPESGGENEPAPDGIYPIYDIESYHRWPGLLKPDEEVWVSEKIHGCNARYVWQGDRMCVASHRNWKKQDANNLWWKAMAQNPWIEPFCQAHPGWALYGEVFEQVQDLKYGHKRNKFSVAVFDIWDGAKWLPPDVMVTIASKQGLSLVPELYRGLATESTLRQLANGPSKVPGANHLREGIVIKPMKERSCLEIGRVILKLVSDEYLERA